MLYMLVKEKINKVLWKKIKRLLYNPKNIWVKRNVSYYYIKDVDAEMYVEVMGGPLKIIGFPFMKISIFYSGYKCPSIFKQLSKKAFRLGFEKGFWYFRKKAKELNLEFGYYRKIG